MTRANTEVGRRDWSPKTPPFILTERQRADVDAVTTPDAKTMLLQIFHQTHCYAHRPIVGVWGALETANFSKDWNANIAQHMAEAWAEYLGFHEMSEAAE
jgi:hypothetical protein